MKILSNSLIFCTSLLFFFSSILTAESIKYLRPRDFHRQDFLKQRTHSENKASLSTNFIENKGQVGNEILYYAYIKEGVLQIKKKGIYLVPRDYSSKIDGKTIFKNITLLEFINGNDNYSVKGHRPSATKYNYYPDMNFANKNKFEGISSFDYVVYHNVYHNIDLKVYKSEDRIEYDWILNPGSKISDIKFRPGDSADMIIDKGDLRHKSKPDEIIHKKPLSYQLINDIKKTIDSEFVKLSSDSFGFKANNYDPEYPLYIDPLVIVSSSYFGGTNHDQAQSLSIDGNGNLYMIGMTQSFDFPLVNSLEQPIENPDGYYVEFIAKFEKDCKTPTYISIFGQDWFFYTQDSMNCPVDSEGNLYVLSQAAKTDWVCDSYGRCFNGFGKETVIIALNPIGQLLFISLVPASDWVGAGQIQLDKENNVYLTGDTWAYDFPVKNAYQDRLGGQCDAYLIKYSPFCRDIIFSTYYGGPDYEVGDNLVLDSSGAAYISLIYATTDLKKASNRIVKFDPQGKVEYDYWLDHFNFLNAEENHYLSDITIDNQNRIYVIGNLPGKYVTADYQDYDVFFYILNPQGNGYDYTTIFGGNWYDCAEKIKIDKVGDIYICGYTRSTDFPILHSLKVKVEDYDAFIMKIDHTTKETVFSSLFGGSSSGLDFSTFAVDYFRGMNIGEDGTIFLGGTTLSGDLPVKNAYQYWMTTPADEWSNDVFFVRLKWNDDLAAVFDFDRMAGLAPASFKCNSINSESIGSVITDWNWNFGDNSIGSGLEITHEYAQPGEYTVTLDITDNLGRTSSDKNSVFVYDHTNISAEVTFEKNGVKANGKEDVHGSVYVKDTRDGSPIHFSMQPVITIDNGNSGNDAVNSEFRRTYGEYEFQFPSGTPGKGNLSVKVDGYLLGQAEIEYLWPQPPINFEGNVIVNRSLTRGQVRSVELQWNANPDQLYQIRKYRVFRSINNNNWELLAELPYYIREYIDNSVPSPKNLKYAVSSIDIDGDESEKTIRTIEF